MITAKNITRHELIGLHEKTSGTVVDETKNMLVFETGKHVAKNAHTFIFTLHNANVKVEGRKLMGRPEDRIKAKTRKW